MKSLLLKKYGHLASAYNSQKEFEEHFFSGEVTIPAKDLLDLPLEIEIETTEVHYSRVPKINFIQRLFGATTSQNKR